MTDDRKVLLTDWQGLVNTFTWLGPDDSGFLATTRKNAWYTKTRPRLFIVTFDELENSSEVTGLKCEDQRIIVFSFGLVEIKG